MTTYIHARGRKEMEKGKFWLGLVCVVISLVTFWLPMIVLYYFAGHFPREVNLVIFGGAIALTFFAFAKYWENFVPQNPEYTNTLIRNPDGSMTPVTQPGPIYLRPGAVIEGNQIPRNITPVPVLFKVNRGNVSLIVKGTVRYYPTDGSRLNQTEKRNALNAQNQLGTEYKTTLAEAISGYFEEAGDIVSQSFPDLPRLLNHRGEFLRALEAEFRRRERSLEIAFGIEIVDKDKQGINLALEVPKEVEAEMLKIYQQQQQATVVREEADRLVAAAKASGHQIDYAHALEIAAAIISGNITRVSGNTKGGVNTIIPGVMSQPDGGHHG